MSAVWVAFSGDGVAQVRQGRVREVRDTWRKQWQCWILVTVVLGAAESDQRREAMVRTGVNEKIIN